MRIFLVYNPLPNYTISHSVNLMHEQFNLLEDKYVKMFNLNYRDLSREFYKISVEKKQDFNNHELLQKYILENTVKPGKIIFFGRYFLTKKYLFDEKFVLKMKEKHEVLLWLDDLQKLFQNEVLRPENFNKSQNLLKSKTIHLIDKFITPSIIFFKNINSPFLEKTIFQFYSINSHDFKTIKPFHQRINKILLSGYIDSSYKTRSKLLKLYKTKKKYQENIHYHHHPGYGKGNADPNYFQTLQNYKYAFIGLVNYPMNYCISKIIETLACGTLAFIEFSSLLKEELGLIAYQHYIPVYQNTDLIKTFDLLKNGKDKIIAENARNYILVNFDVKIKLLELIRKI